MNTETLSQRALSVIDQYLHFKVGPAVAAVPYFNNKTMRAKMTLRAYIGKGSPKDIFDEIEAIALKNHLDRNLLSDESLKKILTDNNLGIDCSGLAYYILDAECEERGMGSLQKNISFSQSRGFFGRIISSLRPVNNIDVATFAHQNNSRVVPLRGIIPGDMITMISEKKGEDRNHILLVHRVDYMNTAPCVIHYTHASADPEDGIYGTGVKQGYIELGAVSGSVLDGIWNENGKIGAENRTLDRAKKSKTELRRLNNFKDRSGVN